MIKQTLKSCAVLMLAGSVLTGCGGGSESSSSSSSSSSSASSSSGGVDRVAIQGARVFKKTCATCHGVDARGMEANGPDLHANEFVNSNTDEQLLEYVVTGRVVEDGADMPPRGGFTEEMLPDEDIKAVIAYIRKMPGNSQP
jgi:mono/diheme cytochrome c family protein